VVGGGEKKHLKESAVSLSELVNGSSRRKKRNAEKKQSRDTPIAPRKVLKKLVKERELSAFRGLKKVGLPKWKKKTRFIRSGQRRDHLRRLENGDQLTLQKTALEGVKQKLEES